MAPERPLFSRAASKKNLRYFVLKLLRYISKKISNVKYMNVDVRYPIIFI